LNDSILAFSADIHPNEAVLQGCPDKDQVDQSRGGEDFLLQAGFVIRVSVSFRGFPGSSPILFAVC
jgi:hypothetical protein